MLSFNDVFLRSAQTNSPQQLCAGHPEEQLDPDLARWLAKDDHNCPEGTAYCWMDCLPLPTGCRNETSPVCLDFTGRECEEMDMEETCQWECGPDGCEEGVHACGPNCLPYVEEERKRTRK